MPADINTLQKLLTETSAYQARLVAVSKTKPISLISEVYQAGHKIFGENYVQELTDKQAVLPLDIEWHFIGHLQSNKVKYITPFISLIHGVDSLGLLKEINKQAIKNQRSISCLLQVHIAEEETKFGLDFSETEILLRSDEVKKFGGISIVGLMGMATNTTNMEQVRKEFRSLSEFYQRLKKDFPDFSELSMGMSSDYKIALEEGSTLIRIGSAIFGER